MIRNRRIALYGLFLLVGAPLIGAQTIEPEIGEPEIEPEIGEPHIEPDFSGESQEANSSEQQASEQQSSSGSGGGSSGGSGTTVHHVDGDDTSSDREVDKADNSPEASAPQGDDSGNQAATAFGVLVATSATLTVAVMLRRFG